MARTTDRILTTHVGSLVRPPKLVEFLRSIEDNKPYDEAAYERCLTELIAELVRQQADAGVDIVSDGEFCKGVNWAFYIHERLGGITVRPDAGAKPSDPLSTIGGGHDRVAFPEFYDEYDEASGLSNRLGRRIVVDGPLTYRRPEPNSSAISPISRPPLAKRTWKRVSFPSWRPASALPAAKNEHYPDEASFLLALAEAQRDEYKTIVDAGLYVQIDDAFLPYMHEKLVPPQTLAEYKKWAQLRIDALNHALEGIPQDRVRYHICWGSWNGPHAFDVEMKDIVDLVLQVRVGPTASRPPIRVTSTSGRCGAMKLPARQDPGPGRASATPPTSSSIRNWWRSGWSAWPNSSGARTSWRGTDCGFAQSPFAQTRSRQHHVGEAARAGRRRQDRNAAALGAALGGVTGESSN